MEQIGKLFTLPPLEKTRDTERGEMMKYFMDKLNPPRAAKGMRPLTYPRMGVLLQGIKTKDLYYLRRICDDSKNFGARFWYELNPKKHQSVL